MVDTAKYVRKPFVIEAVRVTEENMGEVSTWANGEQKADPETGAKFIKVKVHRALDVKQTQAYVGDWVLSAGTGFKVYTDKAFRNSFELVTEESRPSRPATIVSP